MIDDDGRRMRLNWLLTLVAACCLAPLLSYWWFDSAVNVKPYADDSLRIYLAAVQRDDWAPAASRVSLGDQGYARDYVRQAWADCAASSSIPAAPAPPSPSPMG